jgi:SAM-dependent methyltransferase
MKPLLKSMLNKRTRIALRRLYFYGSQYNCNVCNSNVKKMFDSGYSFPILRELDVIGGELMPADTCPICFSNGRTRLLFSYLSKELKISDPSFRSNVLHVAPEYGIVQGLKTNPNLAYAAVDISPKDYDRDIGSVKQCDITAIDYHDDSFDLIICSHVLEHVPDDRQAIRELFRVLRPNGTAILQVPISGFLMHTVEDPNLRDPRERERRFGQHDHVRIYGADYPSRLREGGFLVEIFDPIERWDESFIEKTRINRRERIYVGRK